MFTKRELQRILNLLDSDLHARTVERACQRKLGRDVTSPNVAREELETLTKKVYNLFLEA